MVDRWKPTPREPTNRMIEALYGPFLSSTAHASRIEAYRAMWDAAPASRPSLTGRQLELLSFLIAWFSIYDSGPSFTTIQESLGISSKSIIARRVHALRERGYLTLTPRLANSIRLVPPVNQKHPHRRAPEPTGNEGKENEVAV